MNLPPALHTLRPGLKAITLDLDDTLWAVAPAIERAEVALRGFLNQYAPGAADYFAQTARIQTLRKTLAREQPALLVDMGAFRRAMIFSVLQACHEDVALVEPAFEVFYHQRNQVDHYPDTLNALRRLSGSYRLLALTNGNADVHRVGIGHFFEGALGAADIGIAKPDPRIFHEALRRLQLGAHEVLHVGDDPHLDVQGAINAGLPAVWVNREAKEWPLAETPVIQVRDLVALCDRLGC